MLQEKALGRAKAGTGPFWDFSGQWINELGSEVHLIQTNIALSGSYRSAVSAGGKQTIGDLVGFVDGDLIAFTVSWRDFQAITSWVGQLQPGAPVQTLKMLWQMANQVGAGEEWASINAGADVFQRKP